jgi:AcrR family transcriptional regulator
LKERLDKEQRKAAIIRTALPLFATQGFAATTTKQLAQAAGVSEPLLYKHFPSKEELYGAIQDYTARTTPLLCPADLEPSTATLVVLYEQLMRVLILGEPRGEVPWHIRLRLILNSMLEDGVYAQLAFKNRFEEFAARLEACIRAAEKAGDVVPGGATPGNRAIFAYQVGAWFAVAHLPPRRTLKYQGSGERLLREAVWFGLRGMGMTDAAIERHFGPARSKVDRKPK